ncbi:methionine--tRNA ligase [bacterium]|nr:methionine--tRNA ligase [bacterium]|tara:strand:- start:594 stop:2036 length:1443 start_codon:yes stop_codon:yes gene_type:complete
MNNKFFLTTSIPYVNADPHIGMALELVQADVIARHHREQGDDTYYLNGTDENSLKNVLAAKEAGQEVSMFVDKKVATFKNLNTALKISNDAFIRTTEKRHFDGAQKLWSACKPEDIYKKSYEGLYCVGCEAFYTEDELVDGKCSEHNQPLEKVQEENYFFKLSNYQKELEQLIESDTYKVLPETRKNEVLSFIKSGLQDFSISRSKERAHGWGVPVPGDDSQVMYVWFDALSNYFTALDYATDGELYKKYWPADLHYIGKGIIRFHAVYWPAMLLSAGIKLPKSLFVHGYLTKDGKKISKSTGNVVDPFELVEKYGVDATRYYLLRYVHPVQDSDFTFENFEKNYTADLVNGLGNLCARVAGLVEQNNVELETSSKPVDKNLNAKVDTAVDNFQFDTALKLIWAKISEVDSYIDQHQPWALAKDGKKDELKEVLQFARDRIIEVAEVLAIFLPGKAERITSQFSSATIKKDKPLFPRLTK